MAPEKLKQLRAICDAAGRGQFARYQPCGCVLCVCESDGQCFGCGAKMCMSHPADELPNPAYEQDEFRETARTAMPELIEEVRGLRQENERLYAALAAHVAELERRTRKALDGGGG